MGNGLQEVASRRLVSDTIKKSKNCVFSRICEDSVGWIEKIIEFLKK